MIRPGERLRLRGIYKKMEFSDPAWTVGIGILMVIATAFLVIATFRLATSTRQLAKYAKDQSDLLERQVISQLQIGHASFGRNGKKYFEGIMITNTGMPDVTVTQVSISLGIPVSDTKLAGIRSGLPWTKEHEGEEISSFDPPHRLRSGDRINILYDLDALVGLLEPGQRVRFECQDSFGNTYVSTWVDYHEAPNKISFHNSPSEGFREPTMPSNPIKSGGRVISG